MTSPSTGRPWWSRRDFLKNATAVAAGAYGLSPAFALAAPVPEKFDGSGFKLKAPEPNAKSGGVLRHGMEGFEPSVPRQGSRRFETPFVPVVIREKPGGLQDRVGESVSSSTFSGCRRSTPTFGPPSDRQDCRLGRPGEARARPPWHRCLERVADDHPSCFDATCTTSPSRSRRSPLATDSTTRRFPVGTRGTKSDRARCPTVASGMLASC